MRRILELCAGTGSIGKPFRELGWEVTSLDLMSTFNPTIVADLTTWDYQAFSPGHFDLGLRGLCPWTFRRLLVQPSMYGIF